MKEEHDGGMVDLTAPNASVGFFGMSFRILFPVPVDRHFKACIGKRTRSGQKDGWSLVVSVPLLLPNFHPYAGMQPHLAKQAITKDFPGGATIEETKLPSGDHSDNIRSSFNNSGSSSSHSSSTSDSFSKV